MSAAALLHDARRIVPLAWPVFVGVTVNNAAVRASADDAMYFVKWIDNLIIKTSPGQPWNQYFTSNLDVVQRRYRKARDIYLKVSEEAKKADR